MLATLKNIVAVLAVMLQTRLELFGNELQAQKLLVARQLGFGVAFVFCVGLTVPLAVALAVAIWWEQRVLVLGVSFGLFLAGAFWFFAALRRTFSEAEPMFSASLSALKEDLALLKSAAAPGTVPNVVSGSTPSNDNAVQ